MYNHAPSNYACPFCNINNNENSRYIVYLDNDITAFISNNEWPPSSGLVLITPNKHYENLYEIPDTVLKKIHSFSKKAAIAVKNSYGCDGITIKQNNEPSGDQTVWHYHVHVVPRYKDDRMSFQYNGPKPISDEDRMQYAQKILNYFNGK